MSALLIWLLASLSLLALAALLARGVFLGYPASGVVTRNLSRKEQAILAAAADALFPPGGPIPLSGTEAGAIPYLDAYVGRVDATQRALMRLLFQAVEHVPWILGPRFARFTRLDAAARIVFLRKLASSDHYFLRVIFLSLRIMLTMAYLANEEVARRMRIVTSLTPFAPSKALVDAAAREGIRASDPGSGVFA
jgi:hypothetical protein